MSALKYWVWLSSKSYLKPATRYELLSAFGDPESIYYADEKQLREKVKLSDSDRDILADKDLARVNEILEYCHSDNISILTINDSAYPTRLRNIFDPPVVLYVKGRLPAVDDQPIIGVVGTRDATPYGIKMARKIGYEIAKGGGMVVTGLAKGIDSASAEGVLLAGGSCIGVLGCGIDEVYPSFNGPLFRDVEIMGALVSEYPPRTALERWFFPERNRIVSGLSIGLTVIEAPKTSGALISASFALEQGREVFAVPGNADARNCVGSNNLIREGAMLVSSGWEILFEFKARFPEKLSEPDEKNFNRSFCESDAPVYASASPTEDVERTKTAETGVAFAKLRMRLSKKEVEKSPKREYIDLQGQLSTLTENQLKIVSVIEHSDRHIDDIVEASGLPVPTVLSELTVLQIKGYVSQESGKRFSLNIKNFR